MGKTTEIAAARCFTCGHPFDCATGVGDVPPDEPTPEGSCSICIKCGAVAMFTATGLREATAEELAALEAQEDFRAARAAVLRAATAKKIELCLTCAGRLRFILNTQGQEAMARAIARVLCRDCIANVPGYAPGRRLTTVLKQRPS